jgi:hypothetical protein
LPQRGYEAKVSLGFFIVSRQNQANGRYVDSALGSYSPLQRKDTFGLMIAQANELLKRKSFIYY